MPPPSHMEFQRQIDSGNLRGAGAWLVRTCADDVLGLCTAMVRDRSLAEDLAQDAFGKAFTSLTSFRGASSPRTWLMAIARNRCLDHLRRKQAHEWRITPNTEVGEETAHDAPLPAQLLLNRDDVIRALACLDESQRALVILRFRHGLSYDELGVVFGVKAGTLRMRLSRALATMREALEDAHAPVMSRAASAPARPSAPAAGTRAPAPAPPARAPASRRPPPMAGRRRHITPPPGVPFGAPFGAGGAPPSPPVFTGPAAPVSQTEQFAELLAGAVEPAPPAFRDRLTGLLGSLSA